MSINKAQWEMITDELKSLFCLVQFKYQDTVISIHRERTSESKTQLVVYFNSKINFGWGNEKSESYNPLTPLFWRSCTKPLWSKKRITDMEKRLGKRYVQRHMPEIDKKITFLTPIFPNSTALIRQYKKIEGLELVEGALIAGGSDE